MRRVLVILAALLPAAVAQAEPSQLTRTLRALDFEERRLGNPEELPMHWTKVEGAGLPHYVNGHLTTDRARSGKYSFRFDLNGGSLIYRYDPAQVRIQPGAHYRAQVWVQTTVMPHARARLSAYFVDIDGNPLADTLKHSDLYAAKADDEPWHPLAINMSATRKEAAYLALELQLVQPAIYSPTTLGNRALFPQDIDGSAWFDDLLVSQVPRVRMTAQRPGNIFRRGEPLSLQVTLNDRFTDDLVAKLEVHDATGKVVYQRSGALDLAAAKGLAPGEKRAILLLPQLPPGWYEANLVMTSHGQLVGEQKLDLVLLADDSPPAVPDSRFGMIATALPFEGWAELPRILPVIAAGRVKLGVWTAAGDVQQLEAGMFDQLLVRLQELQITPTACLLDLPPQVARKTGDSSWNALLTAKREDWQPQLAYLVSRHAAHLDRWQLGDDGSAAFVNQKSMRQVYDLIYKEFASLIEKPDLAMPWPAWYEMEGQLPATVALCVPPSVLPHQIPLYMQDIRRHEGHNLSLSLQLLDAEQYGRELQIRDLAQRVVYALKEGANRIDIPLPFKTERDGDELIKQPMELLMIVRTLITTLGGTTFKGKVPIGEGVEAFLFDKDGQGILALWDRGSAGGTRQLALHLGDRPMRVDLWGNVTPLPRPTDPKQAGQVQVALDAMPIFLTDIDGQLAQLRASVAFNQPLIESSFSPHARKIRFTNPYKQAISGTLRLNAPKGWTLSPPTFAFNANPGETFERDLTVEFPYSSFAGPKTILAQFEIQADKSLALSVPLTLTLGLSDVGMQTLALRDGKDIVVQQMITNYGEKPIDYTAFATYPGQARQERLVTNLGAGRTTIKRYRFTDAKFDEKSAVRVGVKELNGTRILNDEVAIR